MTTFLAWRHRTAVKSIAALTAAGPFKSQCASRWMPQFCDLLRLLCLDSIAIRQSRLSAAAALGRQAPLLQSLPSFQARLERTPSDLGTTFGLDLKVLSVSAHTPRHHQALTDVGMRAAREMRHGLMRSERLGAQARSVSPFHLHVSTTQVCAVKTVISHPTKMHVLDPHQTLSEWGPQCPSPPTAASPGETTPFCSRMQGCKRARGSSINDGFTVQYAHVARGVVRGGRGGGGSSIAQRPAAPAWGKMETTFHALFQRRRGARGAGRAGGVPSRSPTRSRAWRRGRNGGDGRRRRDRGTEGRRAFSVHDFTPPQSLDSCRPANKAVEVEHYSQPTASCASHSARQSQSPSRQAVFPTTPRAPPSVRRSPCLPGSVPVSTRWVPGGDGAGARRSRCDDAVLRKPRCAAPP